MVYWGTVVFFLSPVKLYTGGVDKLMFYVRLPSIILIQHKKMRPRNIFLRSKYVAWASASSWHSTSNSSPGIIHTIFPVFMLSRFGSVSVSFYWWVGHMNQLLWGWLIERHMSNGSPHTDRHKQEDTLITDLKTRWRFVRLYILMVVNNNHILLGCDATYFDRHQH